MCPILIRPDLGATSSEVLSQTVLVLNYDIKIIGSFLDVPSPDKILEAVR
jgi:hypothetical protein